MGGVHSSMSHKFEQLRARLGEISDLERAQAVLSWDRSTYMPPAGAEARATQIAALARIAHALFVSDDIGQSLDDLELEVEASDHDSFEASLIRATRRKYDRERKLSPELVAALKKATALGETAWEKAREASDFDAFRPHLQQVVDLTIQKAEALGYDDRIYDALLDQFEPQMSTATVETLFAEMKNELLPLVRAIGARQRDGADPMTTHPYDEQRQWDFGIDVIKRIGFDFDRGRQDRSAHPFTTSFGPTDVRLTTRVFRDAFMSALFSSIHEAGHGTYEQGIDPALDRTPLGTGASSAVHESQARMWENVVGRSRPFWSFWLPRLKAYFPSQLAGIDLEDFYRAINRVQPSPTRVEADEVTYNLHIFLRFDIENMILERQVAVRDLPELWNSKMEEYVGFSPANDAEGVLQDAHWSGGLIGYFPSYSLGNLLSVLFYDQAVSDLPDIPSQIESGNLAPLLNWVRTRIHRVGATYTPTELVERVTGGPVHTAPFLSYIRDKYSDIYGL
jgi:carboxypeptidase Taq